MNTSNIKVAMVGSGSWATALAKIITENPAIELYWWIRKPETKSFFEEHFHNPRYLTDVSFEHRQVHFCNNIQEVVKGSQLIFMAIPAAFAAAAFKPLQETDWQQATLVSATKGIVPETRQVLTDYLINQFPVLEQNRFCVIGGPCHAEEVALEKQSFLTIAGEDEARTRQVVDLLSCRYVHAAASSDPLGVEYAAVLKNVMAIGCGIFHGLGYGDNFQAVLVSHALEEMQAFLEKVCPNDRNILQAAYAGDLLVTAYSQFSRNRTFGNMLGRGYTVQSAQMEMNMIAEGFYAADGVFRLCESHNISLPLITMVYETLYKKVSAHKAAKKMLETIKG